MKNGPSRSEAAPGDADWWPASLAHIPNENPWAAEQVVVAEIRSFDDEAGPGQRHMISVLVPIADLDDLRRNPASLHFEVETSGPRPSSSAIGYTPKFWVASHGESPKKFEPLVLSWTSHDQTVLVPDPGFLMTYGLIFRNDGGNTHWDDPRRPKHDVVVATSPSVWDFPKATTAFVSISKDYLQDYLSLRQVALVQAYLEQRHSAPTKELEQQLEDKSIVDLDSPQRILRLARFKGRENAVLTEAAGSRIVAMPGSMPISDGNDQTEGLIWPGIDGPVDHSRAMRLSLEWVYVSDRVLEDYV